MDSTELLARSYLTSLHLGEVIFEPDGNIPPDFAIDKRIGVEVTRLNQHFAQAEKRVGLEEQDIPLYLNMRELVASFGPPMGETSVAVFYRFARPLERWKILERKIRKILEQFRASGPATRTEYRVTSSFSLVLTPLSFTLGDRYSLTGMSDEDSGGMLLDLLQRAIEVVVPEKTRKVMPYRSRYPLWWLVLVDYIGLGLSDFERGLFLDNVRIAHDWDRLLLLSPVEPSRALEVPRRGVVADRRNV